MWNMIPLFQPRYELQYNLSIPNLVYYEILFKPKKWFGSIALYNIFRMKLPCVLVIFIESGARHRTARQFSWHFLDVITLIFLAL